MTDFQATTKGYGRLWDTVIATERNNVMKFVRLALQHKSRYLKVESITGMPWFMIAAIHMRENAMTWDRHLHNGDPLTARTRRIPAGRPKAGTPPYTWEESAVDALTVAPHDMRKVKRWSVERVLYELEKYNGFGYFGKVNSPYLWAGTNHYTSGKFIADGVFSRNAIDEQPGCAQFLKLLCLEDPGVRERLKDREDKPPKDVVAASEKSGLGKVITGAGSAVAGGTGGTEATTKQPDAPLSTFAYIGFGVGLAILTVGIVIWIKSKMAAQTEAEKRWA